MTHTTSPALTVLPLVYTYVDTVVGRGFLAKVMVKGFLLAREEACDSGTEFWLEGVQPAGLADNGQTLHEAHSNFRRSFTGVLFDIASDARDFDDFKRLVSEFVAEKLRVGIDEWVSLARANREAGLTGERWGIDTVHVPHAEAESSVEEIKVPQLQPIVNELDPAPLIAA